MVILDTNVISEIMRPASERSERVKTWLGALAPAAVFSTAPALAEVFAGIAILPEGRRRSGLALLADTFAGELAGRILPFDEDAARAFAGIVRRRRAQGLSAPTIDLQIAAIASVAGMAIATRNVTDFQECGVEVIDPWTA